MRGGLPDMREGEGMKRVIRVFPRRTNATPDDDLVRIGVAPTLFDEADEVHISVAFTYDIPFAEDLAAAWRPVAPTFVGGPAYGDVGGEFTPGMYVKKGYLIHARGCPNACWFCDVHRNEGRRIRTLYVHDGYNDISSNLLACPEGHIKAVVEAMKRGKKAYRTGAEFTGGLEALRLEEWHVELLKELKPKQMFFAYDTPDDLAPLQRAGKMLREMGMPFAGHQHRAYVLCGWSKDTKEAAEKRIMETIQAGFLPMAMLYRGPDGRKPPEWGTWQRERARAAIVAHEYDKYWELGQHRGELRPPRGTSPPLPRGVFVGIRGEGCTVGEAVAGSEGGVGGSGENSGGGEMITDKDIKVHPELQELHKAAKCCKTLKIGCCCGGEEKSANRQCLSFVGCGATCSIPCRHCLAWEGYGGEETVNAIKAKMMETPP